MAIKKVQFRDSSSDSSIFPITTQSAVLDSSLKDDLTKYITEYNISLHQKNKASGSIRINSDIYILSEAIAQVPEEYKNPGLKLTFKTSADPNPNVFHHWESWVCDGSVRFTTNDSSWSRFDRGAIDDINDSINHEINDINDRIDNIDYCFSLIGANKTLKVSKALKVMPGHYYRIYLNNVNIPVDQTKYNSNAYALLQVLSNFDTDFTAGMSHVCVYIPAFYDNITLCPYYDVHIPLTDNYMKVYMRANLDEEQKFKILDITNDIELQQSIDNEKFKNGESVIIKDFTKYEHFIKRNGKYIGLNIRLNNPKGTDPSTLYKNVTGYTFDEDTIDIGSYNDETRMIFKIPLPYDASDIAMINYRGISASLPDSSRYAYYGSVLTDEDGIITSQMFSANSNYKKSTIVPPNTKYIYYSVQTANLNKAYIEVVPYNNRTSKTLIYDPSVDTSDNDMYNLNEINYPTWIKRSLYVNKNKNVFDLCHQKDTTHPNYKSLLVNIKGYHSASWDQFKTGSDYGSCIIDKNGTIIDVVYTRSKRHVDNYVIPENAEYLLLCNIGNQARTVELRAINDDENRVAVNSAGNGIVFTNGDMASDGTIVNSTKRMISNPISMKYGFSLKLRNGYRINSAHLVYLNGEMAAYNYLPPTAYGTGTDHVGYNSYPYFWTNYTVYGTMHVLPQYNIVLTVQNDVSTKDISSADNFLESFTLMNDPRLHREVSNIPSPRAYNAFYKRLKQLCNVLWIAREQIYPAYTTYTSGGNTNYYRKDASYFFPNGTLRNGVMYSEASEYSKYVGWNVSFRTFLSALANKKSVMYTENISSASKSGYGISYHGLSQQYASSYYGTVCTGLTCYVSGMKNLWISGNYRTGIPGMTRVLDAIDGSCGAMVNGEWVDMSVDDITADLVAEVVRPTDFIWNSGHCSIISDIYKDDYGQVKYVCWAEQTKPTPYITPYTINDFTARLKARNCAVYRLADASWNEMASLEIEDTSSFISMDFDKYSTVIEENNDLCLFSGDYSAFATYTGCSTDSSNNNKIFFNVHNVNVTEAPDVSIYTKIKIFNESDDSLVNTVNDINDPSTYVVDDDGFIKVEITGLELPAGKYYAKAFNNDEMAVSNAVYWEMVLVDLSVTKNGDDSTITFKTDSPHKPYLIRHESPTGMYNYLSNVVELSDSDYEDDGTYVEGTKVVNGWTYGTSGDRIYVKIYIRGDYGTVVRRIDCSNL